MQTSVRIFPNRIATLPLCFQKYVQKKISLYHDAYIIDSEDPNQNHICQPKKKVEILFAKFIKSNSAGKLRIW